MIDVDAVWPARSRAVPLTGWFAPSVEMVIRAGQSAMPEAASLHVNVTVTSVWFHPMAFGGGSSEAVMVGGVRSTLIDTLASAVLPALSDAVPRAI